MNKLICICLFGLILIGCKEKTTFYKNIDTGSIYTETEFQKIGDSIAQIYKNDTLAPLLNFTLEKKYSSKDSIIQPFGLNVRLGTKWVVSSSNRNPYINLIGNKIPELNGESLSGKQINTEFLENRPTLLNIWFIECPPCIAEIPELNKLQDKYKNEINFISITFESEKSVRKFLAKTEFNFEHITDSQNFIDSLRIHSFPKNIFLDTNMTIQFVENGLGENHYVFENIIKKYTTNL